LRKVKNTVGRDPPFGPIWLHALRTVIVSSQGAARLVGVEAVSQEPRSA
jgi:hypothetical protein